MTGFYTHKKIHLWYLEAENYKKFKNCRQVLFNPFLTNVSSWHPLNASGFLVFSGSIKLKHYLEMGLVYSKYH